MEDMEARRTDLTDTEMAAWWPEDDLPIRAGCRVVPLVDGRAAMFAMCEAFLSAKDYILLAGWDIRADLPMVRGEDARVGADESPEQRALIAQLRQAGLDDEALALWRANHLRVVDILGFAARRGVRVGVLLWDAYHLGSHITNNPEEQCRLLSAVGVDCLLDDSSRSVRHMTQSLHQKCAVVDGRVAFLGGIDLTVQDGGDYDRWDTHRHPCASDERINKPSAAAHPWHDVHSMLQGPVVADVLANIVERWHEVALRHQAPLWPAGLALEPPAGVAGGVRAKVARTIPAATYAFARDGIASIKDLYIRALGQARAFVYIENQYLWPEVFVGLDELRWGERSSDMLELLEAIGGALARGVHVAITLPDHPNCGRRFTDGGIALLREQALRAGAAQRFHAFTLGNAQEHPAYPGGILYRPVYTHAKVAIIDDVWWTVGSANLNSRGMRSDAEINVGVLDPRTARELRLTLWTEHLRRPGGLHHGLERPVAALVELQQLAEANRERVRARHPLVGHLLPYLTAGDGERLALPVHPEHGWLDNLEGGVGPLAVQHAGRYV
jgi:phosphatidylserine/phosphatidylglycerophosphate/cardiolipin synthase-like enzyme